MDREQLPVVSKEFEGFVREAVGASWDDPTLSLDIDPDDMRLVWDASELEDAQGIAVPRRLHDEALLVWLFWRRASGEAATAVGRRGASASAGFAA
jgi:hypothetical protein